jgi:hypothetical protein
MKGERLSLSAMGLGLFMIGQPWSRHLFAAGFLVALAGIAAFHLFSKSGKGP